ncbi:DDE-type integrase/transposase/recombinase [Acetobacter sicerae]|uniref:DDE-type integrase/transposase/recombinase n=1 Tax=Acetobacter sicerae TaxID=85325 RepID=A0ABS8VXS5_9PROT|nr:DDE-type integrase/transposase/recombinase [Acetobacter sicerae]MCE0745064.1 DDE-type integrase/transposase/recombinase [Acetobacter sicerae]
MTVAREGYKSARQKFKPVKIGLRPEHPLDVVQMDHTRADIIVVQEHTGVTLGRPWITLCLDVCTRMVLGFTIGFDPPSATVVALTLTQAVLPKGQWIGNHDISLMWPAHGLPRVLHTDNAKEFHSRALRRGCEEHGIRIAFRPRGSPHFGGHIERLMGTLMRRLHALPGTTFSSVAQRGDYPSEKRAILTLEALRRHIALEILGPYHNEVHSALGISPLAAWSSSFPDGVSPRLPFDPARFTIDFLPYEMRTVRRDGLHLFGQVYYDTVLNSLITPEKSRLRVKYDPRDLSTVFLELPSGDYAKIPYADLGTPPISLWEHRQSTKIKGKAGRASINHDAITYATKEQERLLNEAIRQERSRSGRRMPPSQARPTRDDTPAKIPEVDETTAWKTEFLS